MSTVSTALELFNPASVQKIPQTMSLIKNSIKLLQNPVFINVKYDNTYYDMSKSIDEAKNKQEELNNTAKKGSSVFEGLGKAVSAGFSMVKNAFSIVQMLMPFSEEISSAVGELQNKAVQWVVSLNQAGGPLNKIALKIQDIVKWLESPTGQQFFNALTAGAIIAVAIATKLVDIVMWIASVFIDNWSMISPILWGIIAALLVYNATMGVAWLTTLKNVAAKVAHTAISWAQTAGMTAATAAQQGLNSAMAMCPITWIIIGVIALIAVFYAVIAAINHFAGTSHSATGMIIGAFAMAFAYIVNNLQAVLQAIFGVIECVWNIFMAIGNFFGNLFNDPVAAIINLFADLTDAILGFIEKIATGIDFVFGTKLGDTVKGWRADLEVMADFAVKQYGNGTYQEKVGKLDINKALEGAGINMERIKYGDAYNVGNNVGKGLEEKLGEMLSFGGGDNPYDYDKSPGTQGNPIHTNVDSVNDTVDISSEDLKTMRELAEMKSIQNFVTLHPTVNVQTGDIHNGYDVNTIIARIEDCLVTEIASSAQGVYN